MVEKMLRAGRARNTELSDTAFNAGLHDGLPSNAPQSAAGAL